MIHHCPKCVVIRVIHQPAKLRYWCPRCNRNFTRREVALIEGSKGAITPAGRRWLVPTVLGS
jgi:hypothetical protein